MYVPDSISPVFESQTQARFYLSKEIAQAGGLVDDPLNDSMGAHHLPDFLIEIMPQLQL